MPFDQQAALRRVATLVAEGATAEELFSAVCEGVCRALDLPGATLDRYEEGYEEGPCSTVLAAWGEGPYPVGTRWPLDGVSLASIVYETGKPTRIDDYSKLPGTIAAALHDKPSACTVGAPIVVDGKVWGLIGAGTTERGPLPDNAEDRLTAFTELVAAAIGNIESRDALHRLVDEQAALRRIATLVAKGGSASELFSSVAEEVGKVLDVPTVTLDRYEGDGTSTVLAVWGDSGFPVNTRWPIDGPSLTAKVLASGRPARIDDYSSMEGTIAATLRAGGCVSTVGVPILVDGKIWGLICVGTPAQELLPADTEPRLERFTDLVAAAVSNTTTRAELLASRARIVAAGDEARRKIERNLHDGAQQRLIAIGLDLQSVRGVIANEDEDVVARIDGIRDDIESILADIRELSRGLHPALLARGGLGPSLRALARRSAIPVTLRIDGDMRPAESVEIGIYYVVSEALTNAVRHSQASSIDVAVTYGVDVAHATIADDGVGGARANGGSGIVGLTDRVEALGGRFELESPVGHGTRISIELPLPA